MPVVSYLLGGVSKPVLGQGQGIQVLAYGLSGLTTKVDGGGVSL